MKKWGISLLLIIMVVCFSYSVLAVKVGNMIPDFGLKDLEGNDVKISDFQGEHVLYAVWTTKYEACRKIMRAYTQNIDKFKKAEIKIVAISVDSNIDDLKQYLEENELPFTVLHADKGEDSAYLPTEELWRIRVIPSLLFVNPEGKILYTEAGFSDFSSLWMQVSHKLEAGQNVKIKYPILKDGNYEAEPVKVDYDILSENLTLGFLNYDVKNFMASTDVPLEKEPDYPNTPQYAPIYIGEQLFMMVGVDSKKNGFMDQIYVDFNQNLDLTDDGDPLSLLTLGKYNKVAFNLEVKMAEDIVVPYQINCYAYEGRSVYFKLTVMGYQFQIETNEEPINALLLDSTSNGAFDNMKDVVLLDLDKNGIYDSYSPITEWSTLDCRIHLGAFGYRIKVRENGKDILVEKTKL
ncbi:MAG: TlpA family protein disulfide reductase [Halanaerobiales bacterium]|nr:TlpA family protein disulfide reductase [Halanaerobiales bacterium]